jgi:hypothetical protein
MSNQQSRTPKSPADLVPTRWILKSNKQKLITACEWLAAGVLFSIRLIHVLADGFTFNLFNFEGQLDCLLRGDDVRECLRRSCCPACKAKFGDLRSRA